jgi:hypothetical protein
MRIENEAASMVLYGLCATGNVRCRNDQLEFIDPDECTLREFDGEAAFVAVDDVRHFLAEWSSAPQPAGREAVIEKLLADGLNPPRNIKWKSFNDRVRDECNGWLDDRPALGFSDKQIQRMVKELRTK